MSTDKTPESLSAAKDLVTNIGAIGTALLGATALAYILGYREMIAFYDTIGARWVTGLMGTTRMLQTSAWQVTLLVATCCSTLIDGGPSSKTARRAAIVTLAAAAILQSIPGFPWSPGSEIEAALQSISALLFTASAGFTIAELIALHRDSNKTWSSYHVYIFLFAATIAFYWSPGTMGAARAKTALLTPASLKAVSLIQADAEEWRLLDVTELKAILIIRSNEQTRIKVVDFSDIKFIQASPVLPVRR